MNLSARYVPALSVPVVHSHDDQPPLQGEAERGQYGGDWFVPDKASAHRKELSLK